MKSRMILVVAVFLTTTLFAWAGGAKEASGSQPAPAASTSASSQPVTISLIEQGVTGGINSQGVTWLQQYVIPGFEKEMAAQGRKVNVDLIQFGGSEENLKAKLALELKSGQAPDIMTFDGFWIPEFAKSGLIKPLTEVVGPQVMQWSGWKHISPGLQQLLGYKGEIYGIGNGTDVRMIYYRTDLFKKAGIPVPWQPTSWADIISAAKQIKSALPGVTPIQLDAGTAMGEATTMQGWDMVLLGTGVGMYNFKTDKWYGNTPQILDSLRLYKTIYITDKLGNADLQLEKNGREQSFADFRDGTMAMLVEGTWFWGTVLAPGSQWALKDRHTLVGWAAMPAEKPGMGYRGQNFVTISGGTGWSINPNTKHPQLTWDLLTYMFSKPMQQAIEQIKPGIDIRNDVAVAGHPVLTAMAKQLLPITTVRPQLPAYPKVSDLAQLMTERVVSGQMTPTQAMHAYTTSLENLVGAENVINQ